MKSLDLVHVVNFMPETVAKNDNFIGPDGKPFGEKDWFKPPKERRFAYPQYSAADLGIGALKKLLAETGTNPGEIDLLLYTNAITDYLNIGIGPAIQKGAGLSSTPVLQIDTGCVSFLSMLNTANQFIRAGHYKKIAIVTVTNFVSRLKEFQTSHKAKVLGDGSSAALVVPGDATILSSVEGSFGENYGLMICRRRNAQNEPQDYWEADAGPISVEFSKDMVEKLKHNAISLVTKGVEDALKQAKLSKEDVDLLMTHQPNNGLIHAWRESIGIQPPRTHDTFEKYGNLFQSALPVNLADGLETGRIKKGQIIAMGTFANGGDYLGSTVLRWGH